MGLLMEAGAFIFLISTAITIVSSQGAGGGGGGGGGAGGGGGWIPGGGDYGGGCLTDRCKHDSLVIGVVVGVVIGLALLCCLFYALVRILMGRPLRTNSNFVDLGASTKDAEDEKRPVFQSGTWTSQYHQYKKWHGPHRVSLSFDTQRMKVRGSGRDSVGTYTLLGVYSAVTRRIGLTKTYKQGTGHFSENLGHDVTIQLRWNEERQRFEGKWYIKTEHYCGEDSFVLKFCDDKTTANVDSNV